jgi:class 3 adenylate cyclase
MNCGQPVQAARAEDRLAQMAATAPLTLLEKARQANRVIGERRTVTALYMDIVGSRHLMAQLGEEPAEKLICGIFDLAVPIIYRYEGTLTQVQNDELLAFFGAPVAHEDDPVRAVRAALELLEASREYALKIQDQHGIDFSLRISLSTGPVTLGSVGSDLRYDYSALGGTLNLVARIEAAKLAMSVLITEHTYRFIAPFFECTDLGEIITSDPVADPNGQVRIYRVDKLKPTPGQVRGLAGLQSPLVGREREINTLIDYLRMTRAGLGRAALILGEPGIGKTRLIFEWRKSAENEPAEGSDAGRRVRWIQGRCFSFSHDQPYFLIYSLLNSLAGVAETAEEPETRAAFHALLETLFLPDSPEFLEIYPYLGHLLGLHLDGESLERTRHLDPQGHQVRAQLALRRLLTALAARSPLVIILEDLHWADPSSVEMLTQLLPLASSERIMFCLVMRSEPDAPGWRLATAARQALGSRLAELQLEALSTNDSRQLVSNLLEIEALPEKVRDLILKRAEGNPFFVEEVIRMLIDRAAIILNNGRWQAGGLIDTIDIPDNLQGLLLARIDRLPEDVRHTLLVASVIGRQFPVKVLEFILSEEDVE